MAPSRRRKRRGGQGRSRGRQRGVEGGDEGLGEHEEPRVMTRVLQAFRDVEGDGSRCDSEDDMSARGLPAHSGSRKRRSPTLSSSEYSSLPSRQSSSPSSSGASAHVEPSLRIELLAGSPAVGSALAGVPRTSAATDSAGRWFVEALVMGEGKRTGGGSKQMQGVPHASAQGRAPMEAFHAVKWDCSIFEGVGEGEIRFETYALAGSSMSEADSPLPSCVVPARRRAFSRQRRESEVARFVLGFMNQHRGVVVLISGIGARKAVTWSASSRRVVPGQPRCTSSSHDCIKAAVINAALACGGLVAARAMEQVVQAEPRVIYSFRAVGGLFQRARESVTGCRVARVEDVQRAIQSAERMVAFRSLAGKRGGVFIVRLCEVNRVDHAVVVDAFKGVIIDSEETTALELSAENLSRCGGDGALKLRVSEVREIKGGRT